MVACWSASKFHWNVTINQVALRNSIRHYACSQQHTLLDTTWKTTINGLVLSKHTGMTSPPVWIKNTCFIIPWAVPFFPWNSIVWLYMGVPESFFAFLYKDFQDNVGCQWLDTIHELKCEKTQFLLKVFRKCNATEVKPGGKKTTNRLKGWEMKKAHWRGC